MDDNADSQLTLTAFEGSASRDPDAVVADGPSTNADSDIFGRVDARLVQLEAMVPGTEPFSDSWCDLTPREREAMLAVRLEELRTHLEDVLPENDSSTPSIGFE